MNGEMVRFIPRPITFIRKAAHTGPDRPESSSKTIQADLDLHPNRGYI